jgi:NADH dehydrogenase
MILVTGATGFIGRHLVQRLADSGYPVRVLLPPSGTRQLRTPWAADVPIMHGSIHDAESLHQAMNGVHTVFHMASAQWWGHRRDLERIDLQGTRNVITAARSARIGRLEIVSHLGAAPSSAYLLMRIKGQVEELVRSSGLAYTIFRSGVVFGPEDSFVNGVAMLLRANPLIFFQPGSGDALLHPIYINDLIEVLVRSMEHLNSVDQTLEIGGPEYVTFNEMIRTVMRVTQAQRMLVGIPPYLMRTLTELINRAIPRWPMTPQWLDILATNRTASLSNVPNIFGVRPVRFEDTIVTYMPTRHYLPELLRTLLRGHHRYQQA